MAYDPKNLSALAYANGFTLWHYKTADDAPEGDGYFNRAASMLRLGDFIICNWGFGTDDTHTTVEVVQNNGPAVGTSAIA